MLAIALLASSLVLTHLSQRCSSSASEDAFVTTHRLLICASADPSVPLLTYACAALHAHRLLSPSKLSACSPCRSWHSQLAEMLGGQLREMD